MQGLLARGDLRGANVEKDDQQQLQHPRLPTMRLDEHQVNTTSTAPAPLLSTGQHLVPLRTANLTNEMPPQAGIVPRSMTSELVLTQNGNGPMRRLSHSDTTTIAAPTANIPTNSGKGNAAPNSASSAASTLSSLGYISDDRFTVNSSDSAHSGSPAQNQSPGNVGHAHLSSSPYTPRSKSSLGGYSSLSSGSGSSIGVGGASYYGNGKDYYIPKSRSHESLGAGGQGQGKAVPPRPTSLGLTLSAGGADITSSQQQSILCPNCRKSFTYARGETDAFGPWFEHIKFCTA